MPLRTSFRIVPAVLLIALLTACGGEAPPQDMPPPTVTVVTLQSQPVALTRELPGRTHPFEIAEVRPQVGGIVRDQLFTEGSLVETGQPLYQIDDTRYRADVRSARASLARAQASLTSAQRTAERVAELSQRGIVSVQDNDNATAALREAEADVGVARAALANAELQVDYARITAPIDGRIGKSAVTRGALVTANQAEALATIQKLDPIYVDLTQSSSELLELRRELESGALTSAEDVPVTILLEDGSAYAEQGRLAFTDVSVDPTTGSFLLRVLVPNPEGLLLPGMYVRAEVGSGERADAILVPQQGITRDPKGNATAMVVNAEGLAEQRTVQVNRTLGDQWLIDSGLAAGDRVIVAGLQKVQPGAPVVAEEQGAVPAEPAPAAAAPPAAGQAE